MPAEKAGMTHLEGAEQRFVHAHHRPRVVELATVIRCREECHQVSFSEKFVAIFDDLQGSKLAIRVDMLRLCASCTDGWPT